MDVCDCRQGHGALERISIDHCASDRLSVPVYVCVGYFAAIKLGENTILCSRTIYILVRALLRCVAPFLACVRYSSWYKYAESDYDVDSGSDNIVGGLFDTEFVAAPSKGKRYFVRYIYLPYGDC